MAGHVGELDRVLAPGGTLFVMSLVAEQGPGCYYLRLLHKAGEVAPPRTYDEIRQEVASVLGSEIEGEREGCMTFLVARAAREDTAS